MNLVLIGLNHKTAPVEVRECLAPKPEALADSLLELTGLPGVREAVMVATCNRVEVLAVADQDEAVQAIAAWLAGGKPLEPEAVRRSLYSHRGEEAVRHLFRVASSLDSLVVGEPQILGQIKEAYRAAAEAGASRTVLNRLMHKTFQVAKRVRSETNIGGAAVSVSYAAVELAKKIFDDLHGLSALLVGAGEMAELAAEHLLANGVDKVLVANRTLERAVELAGRLARGEGVGLAFGLGDLPEVLGRVDIVITSTGAEHAVITQDMAKKAVRSRRGKPVFFIDIAVPRDIEPRVGELDGCFVYDIDDLTQVVEANRESRLGEAARAERIVAEEVVKFNRWLGSLDVVPTIADLTKKAEDIRAAELARTLHNLNGLSPEQNEALDNLTRAMIKKILHDPIMFLKDQHFHASDRVRREQLALVRRLFRLGENGED